MLLMSVAASIPYFDYVRQTQTHFRVLFGYKTYKEVVIYLEQCTFQTVLWSPGVLYPAVILNIVWLLPCVTAAHTPVAMLNLA